MITIHNAPILWILSGVLAQVFGVFTDYFFYRTTFRYALGNIFERSVILTAMLLGPCTFVILLISVVQGIGYKWNKKKKGR